MARLRHLQRSDPPFVSVPREYRAGVTWGEPRMVVAIKLTTWTRDAVLRHPSLDGVCEGGGAEVGQCRATSARPASDGMMGTIPNFCRKGY